MKGFDNNYKEFMEVVSKQLKINNLNDWYNIYKEDVKKVKGGEGLLRIFNDSLFKLLNSIYPEHVWLPWKFVHSKEFSNIENLKPFMEYVAKEMNVKEMQDWYKVKPDVIGFKAYVLTVSIATN